MKPRRISEDVWELTPGNGMRVPGRIFADEEMMEAIVADRSLEQVANVAHLPGIVEASFAMPDIHWGYGFPIGGVAATDVGRGGVVSPGGVGFDICCGVRLIATGFGRDDFAERAERVLIHLDRAIPRGQGKGAIAPGSLVEEVLGDGAVAALAAGYGLDADLERCEERGRSEGADPSLVSEKAMNRGKDQLGSLGSGNHFLEIQVVDRIVDREAARVFGLSDDMVVVMIHCGSRGLGHQVCTDQLRGMGEAMSRHGIEVPDRQLACVPVDSREGRDYLAAMAAAANFAWANRHILAHETRVAFAGAFDTTVEDTGMDLVFDVAHNLAKLERHEIEGLPRELCVHRKGATRAFGPDHPALPHDLAPIGQPVLIPGSMGTASWVLRGVGDNRAFGSAAHGAGRVMSRKQARRRSTGQEVRRSLQSQGVSVRPGSVGLLSEEAPYAYKDVDAVVEVCDRVGLAAPVARLRPLAVVKG